jgi:hypothetical protein
VRPRAPRLGADGDATGETLVAVAVEGATTGRAAPSTPDLHSLPALLTVAETAKVLRVGRGWVYEHAAELGAIKLGLGKTAPLRIPRDGVRRIADVPPSRRDRSVPAARAQEAKTSNTKLRARPRL